MFKTTLWYHVRNNGDGSTSVVFHETEKEAKNADEAQSEGWAESSVGSVVIKIANAATVFRESFDHQFKTCLIPLRMEQE